MPCPLSQARPCPALLSQVKRGQDKSNQAITKQLSLGQVQPYLWGLSNGLCWTCGSSQDLLVDVQVQVVPLLDLVGPVRLLLHQQPPHRVVVVVVVVLVIFNEKKKMKVWQLCPDLVAEFESKGVGVVVEAENSCLIGGAGGWYTHIEADTLSNRGWYAHIESDALAYAEADTPT